MTAGAHQGGEAAAYDVLIVGAGHGGAQAAQALRQHGHGGSIGLLGNEATAPYDRPALSKDYLQGQKSLEQILLRPPAFWSERGVDLRLGEEVVAVEPGAQEVVLAGGARLGYRHLVWAAGGRPRRLSCEGHQLRGVHAVRTLADVDRLVDELRGLRQVVVIGGGYIGLEAAAVLSKLGKQVCVLEAQERVLARVAGRELSRFYEREHRAHGVDLRLGVGVDGLLGHDGRVAAVRLADGSTLPAQLVIVGIGIVPAVEPLRAAGAAGGNGVDVDALCRTSLPDVYAIGDCAAHPNGFAGGARIRLESVQNANDMAVVAARVIAGEPAPYQAVPWFWSNQYDLRLQTIGLSLGHDEEILRGDPAARSFSVVYLRQGRVIALDCVNATRDYAQGRALVAGGAQPDRRLLADPAVPLKALLPAA